jgi:FkbM family methyltransferase
MSPSVLAWHEYEDGEDLERIRREFSGWQPANLRKQWSPATVIDVGASHGTAPLYEAFPAAHHVLVEPISEYEEHLKTLRSRLHSAEYHLTAVGESKGEVTIQIDTEALWRSSILSVGDRPYATRELEERTVPLSTLDALRTEHRWEPPFGLKIDVEGYEDRVIRGAPNMLRETEFVIAEITIAPRYESGHSFAQFVAQMDYYNFRLCDVLEGFKVHPNSETTAVDAVFCPVKR